MLGKQLFQERLERLNSPGRLPSLSSPLPSRTSSLSRSRSLQQQLGLPVFSETTLSLAVVFFICALLVLALHGHVGGGEQRTATVLGKRSWKDVDLTKSQLLELQIAKKDEEIDSLRSKLRGVISSSRAAEANRASQEALIMSLQQRHETEKQQKYTAMLALSERSKSLDECNGQQQQLEHKLELCHQASSGAPASRAPASRAPA